MPELEMGIIDKASLPKHVYRDSLARMEREQEKYYFIMFFSGIFVFLLSAVI